MSMHSHIPGLFRAIAEYTYDWETWVDSDGVARWSNAALERITGHRVEDCLARSDYPLGLAYEEDRPILQRVLDDARNGGSGNDVEFRVQRRDGTRCWVAISWQGVRGDDGSLMGYRTSIRDIEERKRIEAELHVLRRRAEAAVVARSELLANVSHELRSPVHCIAGFTDLLLDTQLDGSQRRYLELIARESKGMLRQVEDLLQLAAIEAGGAQLERRAFDLEQVLSDVVEAALPGARERGLSLQTELKLEQRWVVSDPTRIAQVLRNLVDNALKFTDQGHVRVYASSVLDTSNRPDGARVELSVHDTGHGIDPAELARLLEPFQQATGTTTRRHGGVGLGLSIVQRLVAAMHGSLRFEGQLGEGTHVHVVLPLSASRAEPATRPREPKLSRAHRGELALVVDDSAAARELLRAMLERCGYRVVEAGSSRAAQARFAEQTFDLVLLDYQMPDADGIETAVALRRVLKLQKTEPRTAIFLLTANAFAREQLASHVAIDGILEKPLSRAGLSALLAELAPSHAAGVSKRARPPPRAASGLLDRRVIEDLQQLRNKQGEPMLARLLARTKLDQASALRALAEASARLDPSEVARQAHSIAGHAAVVGARDVARRARELEHKASEGVLTQHDAARATESLRRAWSRATRLLDAL